MKISEFLRRYILLLFVSFIFIVVNAQHYNPFPKEYTYQFTDASGDNLYPIAIDTFRLNDEGDSVFTFNLP